MTYAFADITKKSATDLEGDEKLNFEQLWETDKNKANEYKQGILNMNQQYNLKSVLDFAEQNYGAIKKLSDIRSQASFK